jgi:hypothetical protein
LRDDVGVECVVVLVIFGSRILLSQVDDS